MCEGQVECLPLTSVLEFRPVNPKSPPRLRGLFGILVSRVGELGRVVLARVL